jgi:hypothetical protein
VRVIILGCTNYVYSFSVDYEAKGISSGTILKWLELRFVTQLRCKYEKINIEGSKTQDMIGILSSREADGNT